MDKLRTAGQDRVLVVSRSEETLARFRDILGGTFAVTCLSSWDESLEAMRRVAYQVVVMDSLLLPAMLAGNVREIPVAAPDTRIIILETGTGPTIDQVELFKHGVHGFCDDEIAPNLLVKAVTAVCSGELWMQRSLITRVIEELARESRPRTDNRMKCLTPREMQVAQMVREGGNNKVIARRLDISERTVKAHLSAIFRKLDIENRLHLALFFNETA